MKAFQFETAEKGLELQKIPMPEPKSNEVVIKIEAAGLCHSDCHIVHGQGSYWLAKTPITLGHEVAGSVSKLGEGISDYHIGDRVAIALITHPLESGDLLKAPGLGYDGGYGQYTVVDVDHIVCIPSGVSFAQAAVATDSTTTAYHAVVAEGLVTASTTAGIIGLGGLGLSGVAIAALKGAKVYGIDIDTRKFEAAKKAGAVECVDNVEKLAHVKFDVIVDFAGMGTTTAAAIKAVRRGGRVVLVGLGSKKTTFETNFLITGCVTLCGSLGGSMEELNIVLGLMAKGSILPDLEEIPFSQVPEGLRRLDRGDVQGRLYTKPNL
jgi:alcohol dehydrogenase, propanol-preferring